VGAKKESKHVTRDYGSLRRLRSPLDARVPNSNSSKARAMPEQWEKSTGGVKMERETPASNLLTDSLEAIVPLENSMNDAR
jgi:hypothetical protein